jgi:hypothetical protein
MHAHMRSPRIESGDHVRDGVGVVEPLQPGASQPITSNSSDSPASWVATPARRCTRRAAARVGVHRRPAGRRSFARRLRSASPLPYGCPWHTSPARRRRVGVLSRPPHARPPRHRQFGLPGLVPAIGSALPGAAGQRSHPLPAQPAVMPQPVRCCAVKSRQRGPWRVRRSRTRPAVQGRRSGAGSGEDGPGDPADTDDGG